MYKCPRYHGGKKVSSRHIMDSLDYSGIQKENPPPKGWACSQIQRLPHRMYLQ